MASAYKPDASTHPYKRQQKEKAEIVLWTIDSSIITQFFLNYLVTYLIFV